MDRRAFVAASCGVFGVLAGCSGTDEPDREARIDALELGNHRRDEGYEFTARIEDGAERRFEAARTLGPAGSGTEAVVFEDPVDDPGTYTVRVDASEHTATIDTRDHVEEDSACLRLNVYLRATSLQAESTAYDQC